VFGGIRQRFTDDVVCADLDRFGQPRRAGRLPRQLDSERRCADQRQ
jgi:hypothetical protein